jgi:uncharacterized protein (TIGR02996 family)
VTTEDDFQAAMLAHSDDHLTPTVFADWLDDRDDLRAEGYRALGVNRWRPHFHETRWYWSNRQSFTPDTADVPADLFALIASGKTPVRVPYAFFAGYEDFAVGIRSHRAALDAFANAFAELPAERRAALLAEQPA